MSFRAFTLLLAGATTLAAWSPRFHEAQTVFALKMIPKKMVDFMSPHMLALRDGARGVANDQVPNPEDLDEQFQKILTMTDEQRRPEQIVKELGRLAHMTQLLLDPSATVGVTPLRENFEAYGDEHLADLAKASTKEPYWATTVPLDASTPQAITQSRFTAWSKLKYERHRLLLNHFDSNAGKRLGSWDTLSPAFAQLQLSYASGVNATANLWILAWRCAGSDWEALK